MLDTNTRLGASHKELIGILEAAPDLRDGPHLDAVLKILAERRTMDLSDLPTVDQARLIAARTQALLPSVDHLAHRMAAATDRQLIVKFGIDPTAADVHVGHAVPMIVASRFQRMGHRVVFIVGDITAKIGDPTGRVADRPPLTDDDIRRNLTSYRDQVTPFFDFDHADFRFNSEWLAQFSLPQFIGILERLPLSVSLQREDFRNRLDAGSGLSMAELVYSVVMSLDSVEINADIEIGGLDQLLNMQMCRRVMENHGQDPEIILATGLIEGTDGSGAKMSKSKGNYVGLAFEPKDMFGKLMSAADRLLPDYLAALTELLDPEIALLQEMLQDKQIHPMWVKILLASDVTGAIHGPEAGEASRSGFKAQFSRKRFSDATDILSIEADHHGSVTVAELFVDIARLVPSIGQVRRIARDGGLKLVIESGAAQQESVTLNDSEVKATVSDLAAAYASNMDQPQVRCFLKCGRALIELC
ncbi:tyrosine--tRNA ligase [Nocardia sp. NPDC058497]|uniref:tyrosine--tRNA ligase n=1 Tax=Nocardia sp. NPDC058497 TaxID=3346529 RepID=UPI003661A3A1